MQKDIASPVESTGMDWLGHRKQLATRLGSSDRDLGHCILRILEPWNWRSYRRARREVRCTSPSLGNSNTKGTRAEGNVCGQAAVRAVGRIQEGESRQGRRERWGQEWKSRATHSKHLSWSS